ncbi:unnamed protein product [Schistosoma margrebowiei]|uniref:Uncharacterized protein n=1 Tax=Schistosoma margrebowiei TaxID=48269 RepID=A0A3P8HDD5_9TREM|nr:unnamed protein product [Schistosoma margrebowiei]
MVSPLDKALREASTVDGVLELQNEHIWSIGYKDLAGSLYVRVRRDANEQLVLAHVTNRLSSLVKYLTIQVCGHQIHMRNTNHSIRVGATPRAFDPKV